MKKFEFVQEHDLVLNDIIFYTKEDGLIVSGSLSHNKDKAYEFFERLSNNTIRRIETVIDTVYLPEEQKTQ